MSDTFTLGSASTVSGLDFAAWLFPGDVLQSAEVSITSSEFGGTTFFDGTVNFTQSGCTDNQFGFSVCTESGSFGGVNLNAGTYWLNLQNHHDLLRAWQEYGESIDSLQPFAWPEDGANPSGE